MPVRRGVRNGLARRPHRACRCHRGARRGDRPGGPGLRDRAMKIVELARELDKSLPDRASIEDAIEGQILSDELSEPQSAASHRRSSRPGRTTARASCGAVEPARRRERRVVAGATRPGGLAASVRPAARLSASPSGSSASEPRARPPVPHRRPLPGRPGIGGRRLAGDRAARPIPPDDTDPAPIGGTRRGHATPSAPARCRVQSSLQGPTTCAVPWWLDAALVPEPQRDCRPRRSGRHIACLLNCSPPARCSAWSASVRGPPSSRRPLINHLSRSHDRR